MKAMILAYEAPDDFARRNDPAAFAVYMQPWKAYAARLGAMTGAPLDAPETATCVSVRDGRRIVEDGPFADSKEQLGGYFIVEARDLAHAAELGAACPAAITGRVDVRIIPDYAGD